MIIQLTIFVSGGGLPIKRCRTDEFQNPGPPGPAQLDRVQSMMGPHVVPGQPARMPGPMVTMAQSPHGMVPSPRMVNSPRMPPSPMPPHISPSPHGMPQQYNSPHPSLINQHMVPNMAGHPTMGNHNIPPNMQGQNMPGGQPMPGHNMPGQNNIAGQNSMPGQNLPPNIAPNIMGVPPSLASPMPPNSIPNPLPTSTPMSNNMQPSLIPSSMPSPAPNPIHGMSPMSQTSIRLFISPFFSISGLIDNNCIVILNLFTVLPSSNAFQLQTLTPPSSPDLRRQSRVAQWGHLNP